MISDLGVIVESRITFKDHITSIVSRARPSNSDADMAFYVKTLRFQL